SYHQRSTKLGLCANYLRRQAEPFSEGEPPGLFRDERIGARLNYVTVAIYRLQRTAGSAAALEDRNRQRFPIFDRQFAQTMSGGESGYAPSDTRNATMIRCRRFHRVWGH